MFIIFSKCTHLATNNPALVVEYPDWSLCCIASQQNWINLTSRCSGALKLCDQNWLVCFCQLKHLLYITTLLRGSPQHRFWNLPFPYTKVHLIKMHFPFKPDSCISYLIYLCNSTVNFSCRLGKESRKGKKAGVTTKTSKNKQYFGTIYLFDKRKYRGRFNYWVEVTILIFILRLFLHCMELLQGETESLVKF